MALLPANRSPEMEIKKHMTTHIDGSRPIDAEISATCFACGRGYCKGDGRFCSTRCREAFDAGFPPAQDSNYARAMTNVPLAAWRVVAGPPGIEIGARFYESILGRKSDGRGIVRPIKKRRKFARKNKGLQAASASWSVPANRPLHQPIKRAA